MAEVRIEDTGDAARALDALAGVAGDPDLRGLEGPALAYARAFAPRDTGRFARSLRARRDAGRLTVTTDRATAYGRFPAFGTRRIPASPFLRRVDSRLVERARTQIDDDLERSIERTGLT